MGVGCSSGIFVIAAVRFCFLAFVDCVVSRKLSNSCCCCVFGAISFWSFCYCFFFVFFYWVLAATIPLPTKPTIAAPFSPAISLPKFARVDIVAPETAPSIIGVPATKAFNAPTPPPPKAAKAVDFKTFSTGILLPNPSLSSRVFSFSYICLNFSSCSFFCSSVGVSYDSYEGADASPCVFISSTFDCVGFISTGLIISSSILELMGIAVGISGVGNGDCFLV